MKRRRIKYYSNNSNNQAKEEREIKLEKKNCIQNSSNNNMSMR